MNYSKGEYLIFYITNPLDVLAFFITMVKITLLNLMHLVTKLFFMLMLLIVKHIMFRGNHSCYF